MIDLTNDSDDEDVDKLPYVGVRQQIPLFSPPSRDISENATYWSNAHLSGYCDDDNNQFSPEEQKREILQRHYEINPYGHHELYYRNLGPEGALHYAHHASPQALQNQRAWTLSQQYLNDGQGRRFKHYGHHRVLDPLYLEKMSENIRDNLHSLHLKGKDREAIQSELGVTDMHQLGNHDAFLENEEWYYKTHPESYMWEPSNKGKKIIRDEARKKYNLHPNQELFREHYTYDIPFHTFYNKGLLHDIMSKKENYQKQNAIFENYEMGREDSNRYRTAADNAEMERRGQLRMEKRQKQESLSGSKRKFGKGFKK